LRCASKKSKINGKFGAATSVWLRIIRESRVVSRRFVVTSRPYTGPLSAAVRPVGREAEGTARLNELDSMKMFAVSAVALALCATPAVGRNARRTGSPSRASDVAARFVGDWKLISMQSFGNDREARAGAYDAGRLTYDEHRRMAAQLMRSNRRRDAPTTDAARSEAYQSYVGYYGTYTIDEQKGIVVHHVEGSSFPHWVGTEQVRWYSLSGDGRRLTLSLKNREDRVTGTLVWERF